MKTTLNQAIATAVQQIHGASAIAHRGLTTFTQSASGEIHLLVETNNNDYWWALSIDGDRHQLDIKTADQGQPTKRVDFEQTSEIDRLLEVASDYLKSLV